MLIVTSENKIQCGPDACAHKKPKNAVNYSRGRSSQEVGKPSEDDDLNLVFDFTFNGECYRTETQAFCRTGKVARFGVDTNWLQCFGANLECTRPKGAGESVKVPCGEGFTEDAARNLCVPLFQID